MIFNISIRPIFVVVSFAFGVIVYKKHIFVKWLNCIWIAYVPRVVCDMVIVSISVVDSTLISAWVSVDDFMIG